MNTFTHYLKRNGCCLIFISLFILLGQSAVRAQVSSLNKGDRIRVFAPSLQTKSIVGTVYDISSTGMLVSLKDSSISIPFTSIKQLDIGMGKKGNALKGTLIGAGALGLTGGIIGAASYEECNDEGFLACIGSVDKTSLTIGGALLGTLAGAAVGALVGSSIKSPKWESVPVTFSAGLAPVSAADLSLHPTVSLRLSLNRKNRGN